MIGFHVPSGQVISVSAKAVVLATGGGCFKPTGYPVGSDTFDGEYIAYQLGLPIAGKEFDDFHKTPASVPAMSSWTIIGSIWRISGFAAETFCPENVTNYAGSKGNIMVMGRVRDSMFGHGRLRRL